MPDVDRGGGKHPADASHFLQRHLNRIPFPAVTGEVFELDSFLNRYLSGWLILSHSYILYQNMLIIASLSLKEQRNCMHPDSAHGLSSLQSPIRLLRYVSTHTRTNLSEGGIRFSYILNAAKNVCC